MMSAKSGPADELLFAGRSKETYCATYALSAVAHFNIGSGLAPKNRENRLFQSNNPPGSERDLPL
jgi:hypothetical protein